MDGHCHGCMCHSSAHGGMQAIMHHAAARSLMGMADGATAAPS